MDSPLTLVWFRRDLRLEDNPALFEGAARGRVVALFIEETGEGVRPLGAASRWWLEGALRDLEASLAFSGVPLVIRRGEARRIVPDVRREVGADAVFWNRRYAKPLRDIDADLKKSLEEEGALVRSFNASLLIEPWTLLNKSGLPFRVFTPFSKACLAMGDMPKPLGQPKRLLGPRKKFYCDKLELLPSKPDWAGGLRETWDVSEKAALNRLSSFMKEDVGAYAIRRDRPDLEGTSRLSPYLAWGQIGPRQIWAEAKGKKAGTFLNEILWREFSFHSLFHFPSMVREPLQPKFASFPWRRDAKALRAWQRGLTGFPLVDAGMRQLWQTGWMHNRVRMVVASFLVKDLLLPWQEGEAWFWDTLVDADEGPNAMNWQWAAGCGIDAAPFFRIFNPLSQANKFDPEGAYVRRYIPELEGEQAFEKTGIKKLKIYPKPLVDHAEARINALNALRFIKNT